MKKEYRSGRHCAYVDTTYAKISGLLQSEDDEAYDKLFDEVNLDAVSQDAMSESQEELLGVVTVAPTPERGMVTVAGTTAVS